MTARAIHPLLVVGLLAGCAGAPESPGEQGSADAEDACSFWEHKAEYEIQERLDGTPIKLRQLSVSFGNLSTKERYFLRNIIDHVWSLPLDSLDASDYPEQVKRECMRRYQADGEL